MNWSARLAGQPARILLAAVILIACAGCGSDQSTSANAPPNVVIFLIDTLRADRLGCYGYDQPTSPVLDGLARNGVRFTNAQAPAPWTCPSVPSIMTSTFVCEHGVTSELKRLSPGIKTIAERFKQLDYHTASFFINIFAGPTTGMDRGFDIARANPIGIHAVDGSVIDRWAKERAAQSRSLAPFFLYVHNIEPHNPFNAPDRLVQLFGRVTPQEKRAIGTLIAGQYRPNLRPDWQANVGPIRKLGTTNKEPTLMRVVQQLDRLLPQHNILYDAVVRQADERLGSVIDALKANGAWDNTLLIVLADHGEELSERGDYLHSQSVYQELTHVPLVIRFPHDQYAGQVVREVVTLVDVLPTVFDFLGKPELIGEARGQSLMPLVRGEPLAAGEFIVTTVRENYKKFRKGWGELRGNYNVAVFTRDGRWKGIWNKEKGTFELYDLRRDPREKNNRCSANPLLVEAMVAFVKDWDAACSSSAKAARDIRLSDEQLAELEQLGYVGGGEGETESDTGDVPLEPAASPPCPIGP